MAQIKKSGIITTVQPLLRTELRPKTVAANAGATSIASLFKIPVGQTALIEAVIFAKAGTERAAYKIVACVANKGGTTALVGSASVTSFEDDTAYAATLVANNTKDTIDLQVTPDDTNDTTFWGYATMQVA